MFFFGEGSKKKKIKLSKHSTHIFNTTTTPNRMKDIIQHLHNLRIEKFILKTFKSDYENEKCTTPKDVDKFMTLNHLRDLQTVYCRKYPRFSFELFKTESLKVLTPIRSFFTDFFGELEFKSKCNHLLSKMITDNKSGNYDCLDSLEEDVEDGEIDASEEEEDEDEDEEEDEEEDMSTDDKHD